MSLTTLEIKSLVCPEDKKQIKKSDGNHLYILVKKTGSKLWRFRYKYNGKYQELALGKFPQVPLSEARKLAIEASSLLMKGISPSEEKRNRKKSSNTQHPWVIPIFHETSSRSATDNVNFDRFLSAGQIPPDSESVR